MKKLLLNRWRTPDGTVLTSYSTHDYVSHRDRNGEDYFIDGGSSYVRMSLNNEKMTNMCIYYDSPFEEIRENVCRGTFDENNNRIWVPLCNMSDAHLMNCITYNVKYFDGQIGLHTVIYMREIIWRHEHKRSVDEKEYTKQDETPDQDSGREREPIDNGVFQGNWCDGFKKLLDFDADSEPELVTSTYYVSILKKCVAEFEKMSEEIECEF